jgi:hypothetical protein
MNYATLVDLIKQYTEEDETTFVANIPNFVKLAEERIYRHVKLPKMRKVCTASITTGTKYFTAPTDFISVDSMEVLPNGGTSYKHLYPKEPNFLTEAYPNDSATGEPKYYGLLDENTIQLAPVSNMTYSVRLHYMSKPESIVSSSTSWVGDNCENALLYGSLVEAYTYLKGEQDLITLYEERFREAVGLTKVVGEGRNKTDEWRVAPQIQPI